MLGILCLVIWGIGTGLTVFSALLAFRRSLRIPTPGPRRRPITILKPIKGMYEGLGSVICDWFDLEYIPGDRLVFCLEDPQDPAIESLKRLMKSCPEIPAQISINPQNVGLNPKINNIFSAFQQAETDLILISDDNAYASVDLLRRYDSEFESGVLSAPILISHRVPVLARMGARLEAMIMATFYAKGLLLAHTAHQSCVMGKSMMFSRKEVSDEEFISLGHFLAEDFATGCLMKKKNLPVKLLSIPVYQNLGPSYTFSNYWMRHLRWGVLRKKLVPGIFAIEPFFYSFITSGGLGALAVDLLHLTSIQSFIVAHALTWFLSDVIQVKATGPTSSINPWTWFVRELTYLPMWVHTLFTNRIAWKGNDFKVDWGGKILPK